MRRVLTVVLAVAMLATMGAESASAGTRGSSQFAYGSWRSHHRVDSDTVNREYWYLDLYRTPDYTFGFIYHTTYSCTTTDGKTRCRRHGTEYGRARNLTAEEFSVDRKLTSMHFAKKVRLRRRNGTVRVAEIVLDLTGTGLVTRSKESYSYRTGCELYKFSGHTRYRDAEGVPSITVDGAAQAVGNERYVTIGYGDSISIEKEC